MGFRDDEARAARKGRLTRATWADFSGLAETDGASLEREARQAWARTQLLEWIDQEIAGLEENYLTLDFETIELDRAGAGDRALFDPSKEASLARRYESEARRGFFKALKEFHKAEAEEADRVESVPPASAKRPVASLASPCGRPSTDREETPIEVGHGLTREVSKPRPPVSVSVEPGIGKVPRSG